MTRFEQFLQSLSKDDKRAYLKQARGMKRSEIPDGSSVPERKSDDALIVGPTFNKDSPIIASSQPVYVPEGYVTEITGSAVGLAVSFDGGTNYQQTGPGDILPRPSGGLLNFTQRTYGYLSTMQGVARLLFVKGNDALLRSSIDRRALAHYHPPSRFRGSIAAAAASATLSADVGDRVFFLTRVRFVVTTVGTASLFIGVSSQATSAEAASIWGSTFGASAPVGTVIEAGFDTPIPVNRGILGDGNNGLYVAKASTANSPVVYYDVNGFVRE